MNAVVKPSAGAARHLRAGLAGMALAGVCALLYKPLFAPLPLLTYNPSDSVQVGWYALQPIAADARRAPLQLAVDDIVLIWLPPQPAQLAEQRGYLPRRIPLLKRIAAVWPQQVCSDGLRVYIDGQHAADVRVADRLGRALPAWRQCRELDEDEVFLLGNTNDASFDSRYFGPLPTSRVTALARPLGQGMRR